METEQVTQAAPETPAAKDGAGLIDLAALKAKARPFYKQWEAFAPQVKAFNDAVQAMDKEIVRQENRLSGILVQCRVANVERARVEEEAKRRLEAVTSGHQALIDRLSKRDLEVQQRAVELERREAQVTEKNRELELLRAEYERRLATMTELKQKVGA